MADFVVTSPKEKTLDISLAGLEAHDAGDTVDQIKLTITPNNFPYLSFTVAAEGLGDFPKSGGAFPAVIPQTATAVFVSFINVKNPDYVPPKEDGVIDVLGTDT